MPKEQERLAEKLKRMADKRGADSPHAEESARHPVTSVSGRNSKTAVTEKKQEEKQEK